MPMQWYVCNPFTVPRTGGKRKSAIWVQHISTGVSNAIYRALKLLHGYCFHAAWITALVIGILNFHWLAAGIAFLLFALRYTLQALIINKTAKDLGEKRRYIFTLPVFDILQPMQSLRWKLYCLFRKKSSFLRK